MSQMYSVTLDVTPCAIPSPIEAALNAPTLEQIHALEDAIRAGGDLIDVDEITRHHFADGIYGRELRIPAGTVLTGKMHRHATLNILAAGEITVSTVDGMKRLRAPAIFTSPANCKKVGYAHTDVVFLNVHPSTETDLAKLEAEFIVPEPRRAITNTKQIEECEQ